LWFHLLELDLEQEEAVEPSLNWEFRLEDMTVFSLLRSQQEMQVLEPELRRGGLKLVVELTLEEVL